jgi:hypothetical protein
LQKSHQTNARPKPTLNACKKNDKDKRPAPNNVLPQLAVTYKIEVECYYQTFVQVDSEVLRNRQLRQHANRYEQREQTEPQQSKANLWQVTKEKRAGGRGK